MIEPALASLDRLRGSTKARVLFVSHGNVGGVARHVDDLARCLAGDVEVLLLQPHRSPFIALRWMREGESLRLYFDALGRVGTARVRSRRHRHRSRSHPSCRWAAAGDPRPFRAAGMPARRHDSRLLRGLPELPHARCERPLLRARSGVRPVPGLAAGPVAPVDRRVARFVRARAALRVAGDRAERGLRDAHRRILSRHCAGRLATPRRRAAGDSAASTRPRSRCHLASEGAGPSRSVRRRFGCEEPWAALSGAGLRGPSIGDMAEGAAFDLRRVSRRQAPRPDGLRAWGRLLPPLAMPGDLLLCLVGRPGLGASDRRDRDRRIPRARCGLAQWPHRAVECERAGNQRCPRGHCRACGELTCAALAHDLRRVPRALPRGLEVEPRGCARRGT